MIAELPIPEIVTLPDALAEYQRLYLTSRNLAARTRVEYSKDLQGLLHFLTEQCGLHSPTQVTRNHLDGYLAHLDGKGYSGAARRRQVSSIKSFFGFLLQLEAIDLDASARLIPPEREYIQPRVLTESEYKRLQLSCRHHQRDAAMIEVLLQTGVRLSELAQLKVTDVELPVKITKDGLPGAIHIHGKGRKDRTLTLNWRACGAIRSYLAVRPKVAVELLFVTKFGAGIGPRAIENAVAKYLKEAGLSGAKVHTLRHTFATQHVKNGTSLETVRKALGHSTLQTTSIYVDLAREVMDRELQQNAL